VIGSIAISLIMIFLYNTELLIGSSSLIAESLASILGFEALGAGVTVLLISGWIDD
jgi:hypothetical protein